MESNANHSNKIVDINARSPSSNGYSYNPWNLFKPRSRSDSEHSVSSISSTQSCQDNKSQKQSNKEEDYLWMMWRS